jgi:hypothetical protein
MREENIEVMVALWNCMDFLKVVPGSDSETCHDGKQIINKKIEVTGIKVEESPVLITFPVTQHEDKVHCMCVYIVNHSPQVCTTSCCLSCHHQFCCLHEKLHCNARILKSLKNYV